VTNLRPWTKHIIELPKTTKLRRKRTRLRIYGDILQVVAKGRGNARMKHIVRSAASNYMQLVAYLADLKGGGFIEEMRASDKITYSLTDKGIFLNQFRGISRSVEAFGLVIRVA